MSLRRRSALAVATVLVAGCGLGTVSRSVPVPVAAPVPVAGPVPSVLPATADSTVAPTADVAPLDWQPLLEPGVGGRVTDVAVDPGDPDRLLVGGDLIGIGLSTDAGASWQGTTGLTSPEVGRFTFHPTRAGEVWVGTMGGPFVSLDGGATWEERRAGFPAIEPDFYSAPVEEVLFHPLDPAHLVAIGGSHREWDAVGDPAWGAIWSSRDGGQTWARLATVAGGTNLVDGAWLADGTLLVAALGRGVWRSEDSGATWAASSSGLPADVRALASHRASPGTVWASVGSAAPGGGAAPGGVWRSDDGGATWSPSSVGLSADASVEGSPDHTAHYDALVVAPSDPAVLMTSNVAFGGEAVYRSVDGGATWTEVLVDRGFRRPVTAYSTPVGAEAIAIDPTDAGRVLLGNAEYVLESTDGGVSWDDLTSDLRSDGTFSGRGYSGLVANRVVFDPARPEVAVLCGFDGANPLVSIDGGSGWRKPLSDWDRWGGCHDASPAADGVWWVLLGQAGNFNGVARFDPRSDVWKAFTGGDLPERGEQVGELGAIEATVAADGTPVVLVAVGGELLRSSDEGASWTTVSGLPAVRDVQSDPARPGSTYLATTDGVWSSTDAGIGAEPMPASPRSATRLALTGGALYAIGFRQGDTGLHRLSADGGSWAQLLSDPLVADVAADPAEPGHLIAVLNDHPYHDRVTSAGVLRSLDGGTTWTAEAAGLPVTRVAAVAFDPAIPGRALIGTFGRGFYTSG